MNYLQYKITITLTTEKLVSQKESSGGAVVRALASHQCGPGSILRLGVICGLSLLVHLSALRGFPRVLQLSPLVKNLHLIQFDLY